MALSIFYGGATILMSVAVPVLRSRRQAITNFFDGIVALIAINLAVLLLVSFWQFIRYFPDESEQHRSDIDGMQIMINSCLYRIDNAEKEKKDYIRGLSEIATERHNLKSILDGYYNTLSLKESEVKSLRAENDRIKLKYGEQ